MAKNQRDQAKEQHWRGVVERQATSGLSVRQFCQNAELAENSFYAWRRTIAERDGKVQATPEFVPVVVTHGLQGNEPLAVELASGLTLKLPTSMPAERVAELVEALESRGRS